MHKGRFHIFRDMSDEYFKVPTSVYQSYYFHSNIYWAGLIFTAILLLIFASTIIFIAIYESDRFTITA